MGISKNTAACKALKTALAAAMVVALSPAATVLADDPPAGGQQQQQQATAPAAADVIDGAIGYYVSSSGSTNLGHFTRPATSGNLVLYDVTHAGTPSDTLAEVKRNLTAFLEGIAQTTTVEINSISYGSGTYVYSSGQWLISSGGQVSGDTTLADAIVGTMQWNADNDCLVSTGAGMAVIYANGAGAAGFGIAAYSNAAYVVDTRQYMSLEKAAGAVSSDGVIALFSDFDLGDGSIVFGKSATISGNGHKIDASNGGTIGVAEDVVLSVVGEDALGTVAVAQGCVKEQTATGWAIKRASEEPAGGNSGGGESSTPAPVVYAPTIPTASAEPTQPAEETSSVDVDLQDKEALDAVKNRKVIVKKGKGATVDLGVKPSESGHEVRFSKANKAGGAKVRVRVSGKVTIKRSLKKGIYKVRVKATCGTQQKRVVLTIVRK